MARRGTGQRNSAKTYYMRLQKGALIFFDSERSRNTSNSRKPILLRGASESPPATYCVPIHCAHTGARSAPKRT